MVGVEHMRFSPGINASNALDLYDMPYTHSLVAAVGWSLLAFVVVLRWKRLEAGRVWLATSMALAVFSHFVLDAVVHVKDLPLLGTDSPKLGLGLWNDKPLALVAEVGLFVVSVLVLTFSKGWKENRGWWALGAGMTVVCVASFFVPTPPGAVPMALTGLAVYVVAPLLAWKAEGKVTSGGASALPQG